jgi:hypothetical protein
VTSIRNNTFLGSLQKQNHLFLKNQQNFNNGFLESLHKQDGFDRHFDCMFYKASAPLTMLQRREISEEKKFDIYKKTLNHLDLLTEKYY